MAHANEPEEVLRGEAAPKQVEPREGNDPSNTPVDELVEDVDADDPTLQRLAEVWAGEQARDADQGANAPDDEASQ